MRCLTLKRPWPYAIFHLGKRVENRSWRTAYRGPLLIHAGRTLQRRSVFPDGTPVPDPCRMPSGVIVGLVDLVDCVSLGVWRRRHGCDVWACGPWCWVLANPRLLTRPFRCPGRLGLWKPPPRLLARL